MAELLSEKSPIEQFISQLARRDLLLPMGVVGIVGLMIVPLPTLVLDVLLAVNITLSLMVLLTAIQVRKPLDFSVFPSLLLIATLFRLGLNVSTTRLILMNGDKGTGAAGEIVATFGSFVVGGSYIVGIVVFLILTLINFIVITRGSGRIAEVSARFTLDALPGKQMSIDSDLAAGLITQENAKKRRATLAQETDFYGAMDGASKFVRGDAIAGLVITGINILGGLIIGVVQLDMAVGEAAQTYTVLTIGDGLVSQIPTLLVSTSSGVVVTQAADDNELGSQLADQLLKKPRVLLAAALMLLGFAAIPGMPTLVFLLIASGLFYLSRKNADLENEEEGSEEGSAEGAPGQQPGEGSEIERMLPMENLELEVGYGLIPLVDGAEGGEIVRRVNKLRQNFAKDVGVILPPMHIKDNLELNPGDYRLMIHGVEVAKGEIMVERLLAMDPGDVRNPVNGIETVEPAFGLPALWIRQADKAQAEVAGYTVVEPAAVVITHLSEVLASESYHLMDREALQQLLDVVARRAPRVVDELIPNVLTHPELLAVMKHLLMERVSVRNLARILEALSDAARFGKGLPFLVDQVRQCLGSAISQSLQGPDQALHVAILDAATEDMLRGMVVRSDADVNLAPDLQTAQSLLVQLQQAVDRLHSTGNPAVLIAPADLRFALWRFASRFMSQVHVLGQNELPTRIEVQTEFTIGVALPESLPESVGPAQNESMTA